MSTSDDTCESSNEDTAGGAEYDSFLREAARVTDAAAVVAVRPLAVGTRLLDGRFELTRVLGQGGMGVVYAARDHVRGGEVALKTLQAATLEAFERLRGEFLVLHDLVHPNLVGLGELADDGGRWFFTMEQVHGPDFLGYVRPGGAVEVARLRAAAAQLATGLGFLHASGKVHRDVKPSNVVVDGDRVVLLDFGLATTAGVGAIGGGTLGYMAPEQGHGAAGPAADWYALGVMLWEALTGKLPFTGKDAAEVLAAKRRGPGALDATVEPALAALAVALLDPDPARRPDGAAIARVLGAAAPTRPPMPRFVGRADERAALSAAFEAARGASRTVLVRGPSGIGKSALVAAFADELRAGGTLVLADRCYERVAVPYKGLHGVAAALVAYLVADRELRADVLDGPDLGLLPAALPALASLAEVERAGRGTAAVRDPAERRRRVFDAFAGLIGNLAARAPLAIVVDDVPWADRDGLALLHHVVTHIARGVLVVATAADGHRVDPAWAAGTESLTVGPLARADALALGASLLDVAAPVAPPAERGIASEILDEAAGHPLHLAELVEHRRRGGTAGVRLEDAIAARAAELPASSQRLLSMVAIAGAPLPQDLLGAAAGLDGAAWWATRGALRAAHLVKSSGAGADDAVEPYHDRVRAAVADRLAAEARRAAHAQLGAALEGHALARARPELVADHLESAGQPARATPYVEAAAAQAADALAFERAADLYRRALRLAAGSGVTRADELFAGAEARTAILNERLGQVCADGGRGADAAEAFLAAAAATADEHKALDLRRRAAEQLLRSGRIDDGIELMDRVLVDAGLPELGQRRFPLASLLGARARLWVRRQRGPATRTPTPADERQLAACWSAVVGSFMVSPLRGGEFQARYLRLALAAGDARRIALGLAFEAGGAAAAGPPAIRAHRTLDEAARWAERADEPLVRAYLDLARGSVAFLCGEWREALARCDASERTLRDECVGVAWEVGTVQRMSLTCLWHMGRINELRDRLARALDEAARRNDLYATIQMKTVLTPVLCLMDDRLADAAAELDEAAAGLSRRAVTLQHWQHMQAAALVAIYRGDPAAAVARMNADIPVMRRGFLFRVRAVRMFTAYVEAAAQLALAATGGSTAAAARARAAAIRDTIAGPDGNPAAAALVTAELAVLDGDFTRARTSYHAAIAGFSATSMSLIADSARYRLGELLGGTEGANLRLAAEAALLAEGIRSPTRTISLFAPVGLPT